jgi:hypothetical protein
MSIRLGDSTRVRIGDPGRTVTAMTPQGKIAVGGSVFDARSDSFWIDPNVPIVVVRGDHLGLVVRRLEDEGERPKANIGEPTPQACWQESPPLEAVSGKGQADAAFRARFSSGLRESVSLGALYGLLSVYLGFAAAEMEGWLGPWIWAGGAGLCGALWGGLLFLIIHALLRDMGEFQKLVLVTLGLALVGSTGGTVAGYSLWGLIGGLTGAVLGAFSLGVLVPLILVAAQAIAPPPE